MNSHEPFFTWLTIGLALIAVVLFFSRKSLQNELARSKEWYANLQKKAATTDKELQDFKKELKESKTANTELEFKVTGLKSLIEEKAIAFPWLTTARADFDDLIARRDAEFLESKKHPAAKSADLVREHRLRARVAETNLNRSLYRQLYAEKLFPWLSDLLDEDLQQMVADFKTGENTNGDSETSQNPAQTYLSHSEYMQLSETERNQRALDRHEISKKTKWQIGREFERYVGHLLEEDGYDVSYEGATKGLEDLGRDLVATRKDETIIVQCKYWSSEKTIHEKHVYQLYGTFCDYVISKNLGSKTKQGQLFGERDALHSVRPLLLTTAKLSDRAQLASNLLNVESRSISMEKWKYPKIKCNISQRDGTKIYHLPFDQQYDTVKIEKERGEFYVATCQEAEKLGFRRAWRWKSVTE